MEDTLSAEVYARYFHIYWVPCFPIKKTAVAYCSDCGYEFPSKFIPKEADAQILSAKKSVKTSPKHFIGLMIFCLVLVYSLVRHSQVNNQKLSYIEQPMPDDLHAIKIKGGYTLLKVALVKGDTVGFYQTDDQETKYLKLKGLERRAVFGSDTIYFSKSTLFEKLEEGEIVGISRD